jgi:hypothetical protein
MLVTGPGNTQKALVNSDRSACNHEDSWRDAAGVMRLAQLFFCPPLSLPLLINAPHS